LAEKVPTGATVIVDDPLAPTTWVSVVGLAVTVKSAVVSVTTMDLVRPPPVPETVHVALGVPMASVRVRVKPALGGIDTLAGPVHPVRPVVAVYVRAIEAVNPLSELTLIAELPVPPALTATVCGLAVILKSCTVIVIVADLVRPLAAPDTWHV